MEISADFKDQRNGLGSSFQTTKVKYFLFFSIAIITLLTSFYLFRALCLPRFEASFILSPGYLKYMNESKVVIDRFYSARDLQIFLQHDFGNKQTLGTNNKFGNIEVIKNASELLKVEILGNSKDEIVTLINTIIKKYERLPKESLKTKDVFPQSNVKVIQTHLVRGGEVRESKFFSVGFSIKIIVLTLISVISFLVFLHFCFSSPTLATKNPLAS